MIWGIIKVNITIFTLVRVDCQNKFRDVDILGKGSGSERESERHGDGWGWKERRDRKKEKEIGRRERERERVEEKGEIQRQDKGSGEKRGERGKKRDR